MNGSVVGCDFVAFAVLHRGFRQREHRARGVPPHLSSRLGGSQEVAATLASDTVTGGGVRMRLGMGEVFLGEAEAVAKGA